METFGYKFQDLSFTNYWVVKQYEKENNVFVPFVANLDQYKEVLADKNIDDNYNYSLDFLSNLRKEKNYIRLFYSGGSDSDFILKTAVDNNIYIDEIVLITRNLYNKPGIQPCDIEIVDALAAVEKLTSDQVGKVKIKNYDADFMRQTYQDESWPFTLPSGDFSFRIVQPLGYHNDTLADCQILGKDKPFVFYYNDKWYATILDTMVADSIGVKNSCLFYLEPGNIKGFVSKARKLRNFIVSNSPNKEFSQQKVKFYSSYTSFKNNSFAGTSKLGKYNNKFLNQKDILAAAEVIQENDIDLLLKWSKGVNHLVNVFPDLKVNNEFSRLPTSKFAWMIDLDSLEIFSPYELIPNGF